MNHGHVINIVDSTLKLCGLIYLSLVYVLFDLEPTQLYYYNRTVYSYLTTTQMLTASRGEAENACMHARGIKVVGT